MTSWNLVASYTAMMARLSPGQQPSCVLDLEISIIFASTLLPGTLKCFRTLALPTLASLSCFPSFSYPKSAYKKVGNGHIVMGINVKASSSQVCPKYAQNAKGRGLEPRDVGPNQSSSWYVFVTLVT